METRDEAYRCEWALRYYRDHYPEKFWEVLSMGSMPVLHLRDPKVLYDSLEDRLSFTLSMESQVRGLPRGLSEEQIVGPPLFDFECRPDVVPEKPYSRVVRKSEPILQDFSEPSFLGSWRVRAVLDDVVGGPWTYVDVSWLVVARGIQCLVEVHNVSAMSVRGKEMIVEWSASNPLPGLRYLVERTELTPDLKPSASGPVTFVCDGATFVDGSLTFNQMRTPYVYCVRALLGGVKGIRVFARERVYL